MWFPSDLEGPGELDRLPSVRHAIASAEVTIERQGGFVFVLSRVEGRPFILLRRLAACRTGAWIYVRMWILPQIVSPDVIPDGGGFGSGLGASPYPTATRLSGRLSRR